MNMASMYPFLLINQAVPDSMLYYQSSFSRTRPFLMPTSPSWLDSASFMPLSELLLE